MNAILKAIGGLQGFQTLLNQLQGEHEIESLSLSRAARLPVAAALQEHTNRPVLLITHRADRALTLVDELALWVPDTSTDVLCRAQWIILRKCSLG